MMTNVRASNLHPTFLPARYIPPPHLARVSWTLHSPGGTGEEERERESIPLRPVSSRRRIVDLPSTPAATPARVFPSLRAALNLPSKTSESTERDVTLVSGVVCEESAPSSHQADVLANCLCFYHVGIFLRPTFGLEDIYAHGGTTFAGLGR